MAFLVASGGAIAKRVAQPYFGGMIRLVMLLFVFSALAPMRPAAATPAQTAMSCHHDGQDERQQAPADHQAKHACLGCALLAPRIAVAEAVSALRPIYAARLVRPIIGRSNALDPPPPRAEG